MNEYYVYALLDTRKPGPFKWGRYTFEYEPFYLGKGKGRRRYSHFCNVNKDNVPKSRKNRTIRKIELVTGAPPKSVIVQKDLTDRQALDLEIKLIKRIGRLNLKTGPLTNLTDGGEGVTGLKHSIEYKIERSRKTYEWWHSLPLKEQQRIIKKRGPCISRGLRFYLETEESEHKEARYIKRNITLFSTSKGRKRWGRMVASNWERRTDEQKQEYSKLKSKQTTKVLANRTEEEWEPIREKLSISNKAKWDSYTEEEREARSEAHKQAHANMTSKEKARRAISISKGKQMSDQKLIGAVKSSVAQLFKTLDKDGIFYGTRSKDLMLNAGIRFYSDEGNHHIQVQEWIASARKRLIMKYGSVKDKALYKRFTSQQVITHLNNERTKIRTPVDPLVKHISNTQTAIVRLLMQLGTDGILNADQVIDFARPLCKEANSIELTTSARDYCLALRKRLVLKYASKGIKRELAARKFETPIQIKNWMDRVRNVYCKNGMSITEYCE